MCKAKLEASHPTFKVMDVMCGQKVITVDFNQFEIKSKKVFRVMMISDKPELIVFSQIKPINPEDKVYLDYVQKEYGLIAGQQILAQKQAEKNLSQRRVA
jgi:hypothetical protein